MHKSAIKRVRPVVMNLPMDVMKAWDGEVQINTQDADGKWHLATFKNHVLIGGLQYLAKLLYRIPPKVAINTFEHDLYAGSVGGEADHVKADETDTLPYIQGFNLSVDGSQGDGVKPYPRHKIGYDFDHLIPFRMIPESENEYALYRNMYLHSRVVELDGRRYLQYFTKKADITYRSKLDDDTDLPQHPNDNLTTNKDSRLVATFNINLNDDELVEWFRLTKEGGAQSARYSSVLTMIGSKATWTDPTSQQSYPTMADSVVFSRCNHVSVPKNVSGVIICRYQMLHI